MHFAGLETQDLFDVYTLYKWVSLQMTTPSICTEKNPSSVGSLPARQLYPMKGKRSTRE